MTAGDPNMALKFSDRAIQVHGAAGVSESGCLAEISDRMYTLWIADGPDEVYKTTIARREILRRDPRFRMNAPAVTDRSESSPQAVMRP